jgi:mRNA-degrading endonuclease RelE of RelBE toxin-antitoxin system
MSYRFDWSPQARAHLRNIDREAALRILHALTRFARGGSADIAALHGPLAGTFRLRLSDWRVQLRRIGKDHCRFPDIEKRDQAYR